jgi:hypothetical protein
MRFLQSTPDDFRAGIGVLQVRHASDSPVRGRVRGGRHRASFEWGVAFLGFENAKRKERRKKMKEEKKETTLRNAARSTRMNYTHTHTHKHKQARHTHSFTGILALFSLLLLFHDKSKQLYGTVASGG